MVLLLYVYPSIDKKIKTLRDKSVAKFSRPNKMLMTCSIERILSAESEVDYFEIGKIITHSQGDYRRLVNILILVLQ